MDRNRDLAKGLSRIENKNKYTPSKGVILIDDTTEHVGPFCAITALAAAAVDVDQCNMSFIEDVADFTIPVGVTIYGNFTSIELDSGSVLAYYA